ncbi:MAG: prepilin-type N-terminal cleavage/methylation domain-containing protein [Planctomycetota bacterium]
MTKRTKPAGFTLVEILIVVVILGILASIVVPQFSSATDQSKAVATASIVRTVQSKVLENYAMDGEYAATLETSWFVEGSLPHNPLAPEQRSPIVIYDSSAAESATHPADKLVTTSGAFWYNPNNGTFRALVPAQDTEELTLELYNQANSTRLGSLAATSG